MTAPRATAAKALVLAPEGCGQGSHRAVGGINHRISSASQAASAALGDTQRHPNELPIIVRASCGGAAVTKKRGHSAAAFLGVNQWPK